MNTVITADNQPPSTQHIRFRLTLLFYCCITLYHVYTELPHFYVQVGAPSADRGIGRQLQDAKMQVSVQGVINIHLLLFNKLTLLAVNKGKLTQMRFISTV